MSNQLTIGMKRLSVTSAALEQAPKITPQLTEIMKSFASLSCRGNLNLPSLPTDPMAFLHASDTEDARKIVEKYYSVPRTYRNSLPIEAFCLAAGVSPLRVLELIVSSAMRMGVMAENMVVAMQRAKVVDKNIEMALTDGGFADRELFLKATGFIPTAKAPSTTINVNQQANATAPVAIVAPPSPEQTIRRFVDRFNDRALPAAPPPAELPAPPPEAEDADVLD
jgi:hypothetical protein